MVTGGSGGASKKVEPGDSLAVAFLSPLRAVTEMPDYPRACSRCGVLTAEADFGADRSKKSGHKSHCRACERADYASRKDELQARRDAVREAALQARLKELEVVHRERVAAAKREHEAGVRRQKKLLRELGVPDLSPEEITERTRRRSAKPP
jgi:hypothetical protein